MAYQGKISYAYISFVGKDTRNKFHLNAPEIVTIGNSMYTRFEIRIRIGSSSSMVCLKYTISDT